MKVLPNYNVDYFLIFPDAISSFLTNLLLLQGIGITAGIEEDFIWYISALFWVMLFYFYIIKNINAKYANLIIAICIYFSLMGIVNFKSDFSMLDTFYGFVNGGMLKALADIGIGYFIGIFYNNIKECVKENYNSTKDFLLFSFIEISIFTRLITDFIATGHSYRNNLIFIIMFSILFILFLIQKGALSKLFNNKFSKFLGKYSYSTYVMQGVSFCILGIFLHRNNGFTENIVLCISVSLIFSAFLGILTYHFVEAPSIVYLKKKFKM